MSDMIINGKEVLTYKNSSTKPSIVKLNYFNEVGPKHLFLLSRLPRDLIKSQYMIGD